MPYRANELPMSCKIFGTVLGSIAASVSLSLGVLTCFSFRGLCIMAGVWMIVMAVFMLIVEAPVCCSCCYATNSVGEFLERTCNLVVKAITYIILSIVPIPICRTWATVVACSLVFITGVFYAFAACFGGISVEVKETKGNAQYDRIRGK